MWDLSILYQGDLYRFWHEGDALQRVEFYPRAQTVTPTIEDLNLLPKELISKYESALIRTTAGTSIDASPSLTESRSLTGYTSESSEHLSDDNDESGTCRFDW